mgnify:CR=1 FL=1
MLTDILAIMKKHNLEGGENLDKQIIRQQRLSEQLERLISPEGTYPAVGRSIVYRLVFPCSFSNEFNEEASGETSRGASTLCAYCCFA